MVIFLSILPQSTHQNKVDRLLDAGDCWIGISLAQDSSLILSTRMGKHTDEFIEALVISTEGKTACPEWDANGWGGYERVLSSDVDPLH